MYLVCIFILIVFVDFNSFSEGQSLTNLPNLDNPVPEEIISCCGFRVCVQA